MLKRIGFSNKFWGNYDTKLISSLIEKLWKKNNIDNIILDIDDLVREDDKRTPVLYGIVPYIVEIAVKKETKETKKIWNYLGCWVFNQNQFRAGINTLVLEYFDEALKFAESRLCEFLSKGYKIDMPELENLYTCLFAFAGHDFGCMVVDTFRDYEEGYASCRCKNGHLNEFAVYDNGVFSYNENEKEKDIFVVPQNELEYPFEKEHKNNWKIFIPQIDKCMQTETSLSIKSHLRIAMKVLEQGITKHLPMRFAFSVCGSLLYCNGCTNCANRFFHAWDKVVCSVCAEEYIFADYWCC